MTNWYDYDKQEMVSLPPVDTQCEYTFNGNIWYACKVISHSRLVLSCPHLICEYHNGLQIINHEQVNFRPLDWNKVEVKNKLISAVYDEMLEMDGLTLWDKLEVLYDQGYLKFPEDK